MPNKVKKKKDAQGFLDETFAENNKEREKIKKNFDKIEESKDDEEDDEEDSDNKEEKDSLGLDFGSGLPSSEEYNERMKKAIGSFDGL